LVIALLEPLKMAQGVDKPCGIADNVTLPRRWHTVGMDTHGWEVLGHVNTIAPNLQFFIQLCAY
jgi:hypothetical protein